MRLAGFFKSKRRSINESFQCFTSRKLSFRPNTTMQVHQVSAFNKV
jgi:hypothetical protein